MSSKSLIKTITYLDKTYNLHTMILYGSFADGTNTSESDIDIICFGDNCTEKNDNSIIEGYQLDAWIYPTEMMDNIQELLHIRGGKVLVDNFGRASAVLEKIENLYSAGPDKLPQSQINFQKKWISKMLKRSKKGDIEGNFRLHWMLFESLEMYFSIRGLWYLGPKKSLIWLESNDPHTYNLFNNALKLNASMDDIEELINFLLK